jgi:hypothetical protein
LYGEVADQFPTSARAAAALARKAALEDKAKLRMLDPDLQTSGAGVARHLPCAGAGLPVERARRSRLRRARRALRGRDVSFALAPEALEQLANRFSHEPARRRLAGRPNCTRTKVKDPARARAAYALVPASSSRYRDAQKKLR